MSDLDFTFPEMPSYQGFWNAIYFEPIVGSGERITIAVSAASVNGEYRVVRATRPELFECLYGIQAPRINNMVDIVIKSLEGELAKNKSIDTWVPPFDGIIKGANTYAVDENMTGILKQGLRFCASLSQLSIDAERDDVEEVQPKRYSSKFSKKIKNIIQGTHPSLMANFHQKIKISESGSDALTEYGFLNDRYVTNFGLLLPSRLSSSLNIIKAKIYDIESLKKSSYLMKPERYEIVIGTPSFDDPTLTDAAVCKLKNTLDLVEEMAVKDDIHIFRALDAGAAAKHVLEYAA
ncbi:hypothetical protein BCT30_05035 [Enterovibrio norvegicus]|uniref:hypothetical protein n=1 Tax=Enterovibrio norvegicus TaxID=188144 RepID=UPI000C831811|nr:hypothetical protein [Enterovibrio norvegicus]PMI33537.1 hypothetical protein BCU46_22345 [Enterovibrio norvegicus]PMN44264.1 hypothetical protein BCT30_05035 [Enterovibrio norvegicus]